MPALTVTVNVDEQPWEDIRKLREEGKLLTAMGDEAGLIRVGALPGGMQSGKTSVAIAVTLPDGTVVLTETSLALFLTAASILKVKYPNG